MFTCAEPCDNGLTAIEKTTGLCECLCGTSSYSSEAVELIVPSNASSCISDQLMCGTDSKCVAGTDMPMCLVTGTGETPVLGTTTGVSCQVKSSLCS